MKIIIKPLIAIILSAPVLILLGHAAFHDEEIPCSAFIKDNIQFRACNSKTEHGYYWKKTHWSEFIEQAKELQFTMLDGTIKKLSVGMDYDLQNYTYDKVNKITVAYEGGTKVVIY